MSFDVEEIVDQSYQSHTEESEQQDIGLLPIEQRIIDPSLIFQDIGDPYHDAHHQQKNAASHRGRSLLVFMEMREDGGLLPGDR